MYIDNRITCLAGLLLGLCGSLIATDWQSLGGDPCSKISDTLFTNSSSSVQYDGSTSGSGNYGSVLCEMEPGDMYCIAEKSNVDLEHCMEGNMVIENASCVCEAFSNVPDYHCFWNPHSRVTGRECERCARLCRSHERSLNLVQFLLGISIVSAIIVLGRISITVIVSDALAGESQVNVLYSPGEQELCSLMKHECCMDSLLPCFYCVV